MPMEPKQMMDLGEKIAESVSALVQAGALSAKTDNHPDLVYLCAMGVIGALETLALTVGDVKREVQDDSVSIEERKRLSTTPASLALAALLPYRMITAIDPDSRPRHLGLTIEFGPHVVFDAIESTKKFLGYDPSKYLDKRMVERVYEIAAAADDPLTRFLASRQAPPSSNMMN